MQKQHEVEDGESGDKMQTKVEVTREPKPRIGARETGQQTSEKKAEEWTYKMARKRAVDAEEDRCISTRDSAGKKIPRRNFRTTPQKN